MQKKTDAVKKTSKLYKTKIKARNKSNEKASNKTMKKVPLKAIKTVNSKPMNYPTEFDDIKPLFLSQGEYKQMEKNMKKIEKLAW